MADTDTSTQTRAQNEADVHEMRAGARRSPGKGPKRFLIPLAALLVLGGGGAGAYAMFLAPEPPAEEVVAEEPVALTVPMDHAYIDLEPLFVPYRGADGYRHKIALMMALEIDRAHGDESAVRAQMPRLREAYLRALMDRPLPGTEDGTIEVVYLKNRIRAENLKIFGPGVVNDVLIRDIRVVPG